MLSNVTDCHGHRGEALGKVEGLPSLLPFMLSPDYQIHLNNTMASIPYRP